MSDKLRKYIDVERQQLNRLIEEHRNLLDSCASREPTNIEVSALATFLHSFYSGIENSLKRIAIEIDGVSLQATLGTDDYSRAWQTRLIVDLRCYPALWTSWATR